MKRIIATIAAFAALVFGLTLGTAGPADAHTVDVGTTVAICHFIGPGTLPPDNDWYLYVARTDHIFGQHVTKCDYATSGTGLFHLCRLLVWETSVVVQYAGDTTPPFKCW